MINKHQNKQMDIGINNIEVNIRINQKINEQKNRLIDYRQNNRH